MLDATVLAAIAALSPPGIIEQYAGASAPTGYLMCDGTAYSRTTYAALYAAIGTAYGAGDGSTTFNVPDLRGRGLIGAGAPTHSETITSVTASGNAIAVAANNAKWVTGMTVVVSGASGFTGLTNGTYYIVRASSSTVQFATTLANAQNGTVASVTGTGSCVLTWTGTARSLGERGGEEAHAMSSTELLSHTHTVVALNAGLIAQAGATANVPDGASGGQSPAKGGNAAMNVMNPYVVGNYIIKT